MTTVDQVIEEWESKRRRMGCVAATRFVTSRLPAFHAKRLTRWTQEGDVFEHVVATDGLVVLDLAPYADAPRDVEEGYVSASRLSHRR